MLPRGFLGLGEDLVRARQDDLRRAVAARRSWDQDHPRWRVRLGARLVRTGARLMGAPATAMVSRIGHV